MQEKKPNLNDLQEVVCSIDRLSEIADKLDPERRKTFDVAPIDNAVHELTTFFLRHTGTIPSMEELGCPSKDKLKEFLEKRKSRFILEKEK